MHEYVRILYDLSSNSAARARSIVAAGAYTVATRERSTRALVPHGGQTAEGRKCVAKRTPSWPLNAWGPRLE